MLHFSLRTFKSFKNFLHRAAFLWLFFLLNHASVLASSNELLEAYKKVTSREVEINDRLSKIDSLLAEIDDKFKFQKARNKDSILAELYVKKTASLLMVGRLNDALKSAEINKTHLLKHPNPNQYLDYLKSVSGIFYRQGNLDSARVIMIKAYDSSIKQNNKDDAAQISNNLGLIELELGDYVSAYEHLQLAINHFYQMGDSLLIARTSNSLGFILSELDEYDKAIAYYRSANKFLKALGNQYYLASNLIDWSIVYQYNNRLDTSKILMLKALKIARDYNYASYETPILHNLGALEYELENYLEAEKHLLQAKSLVDTSKENLYISRIHNTLGKVYSKLNKPEKALENLKLAQAISEEKKQLNVLQNVYFNFYTHHESIGNFEEALSYYKLYETTSDSIENSDIQLKLDRLNAELEAKQNENELKLKKAELDIVKAKTENQEGFIKFLGASSIILLISLSVLGFAVYKLRTKQLLINTQSEEINELNLILSERLKQKVEELDKKEALFEEYSYFNSHNLRSPVAKILGLIDLLQMKNISKTEEEKYKQNLNQATLELDEVIKELQQRLQNNSK